MSSGASDVWPCARSTMCHRSRGHVGPIHRVVRCSRTSSTADVVDCLRQCCCDGSELCWPCHSPWGSPTSCILGLIGFILAELCAKMLLESKLQVLVFSLAAVCVAHGLSRQIWNLLSPRILAKPTLATGDLWKPLSPEGLQPSSCRRQPSESTTGRRQRSQEVQNPIIAERIQQLSERTRICSRKVWEESYLPGLRGAEGAEQMRPAMAECCVCVSSIEMEERVRGLACGHIFHLPCLAEWFIRDRTFTLCCPLCRVPLSDQDSLTDECLHPSTAALVREATQ
mmetsp:Transcript_32929/g.94577  ORF Transcript_32929/g.94577 Transcript_32929/m.94577 type:complete len:284 (-) Transcript_32929:304-1155(-)